jgi:asparagine synthase (glutamine-hydrolysing)
MSGIAGIAQRDGEQIVSQALHAIEHRGRGGARLLQTVSATLGAVDSDERVTELSSDRQGTLVYDGLLHLRAGADVGPDGVWNLYRQEGPSFVNRLAGPFALAIADNHGLFLARDLVGVAPLYYGFAEGALCFASEVKALLGWATNVRELPPGHCYFEPDGAIRFDRLAGRAPLDVTAEDAADELRARLDRATLRRLSAGGEVGAWLSGGLDSSAIAAIGCRLSPGMKTFAVGVEGAPDLEYARTVAQHIGSKHFERVVTLDEMLVALPEVIYHLESFDALLVRSSVMNFLAGEMAADHVDSVLSGEGGDELFAGYEYLKGLEQSKLADELVDITRRLHNTALQRVDRCSSAHGIAAHTPFLDPDVLDYALSIPVEYKICRNGGAVEKWILRRAVAAYLPESVVNRPKAKFWEGAGVTDILERHIEEVISDSEFAKERTLPGNDLLNTKEELFYYRIFREHFGEIEDLSFVGRTKGAPVA